MSASRLAAALGLATTLITLAGCGQDDRVLRPDGEAETRATLSVAAARARAAKRPVLVRGYLAAPFDDSMRLCSRLPDGACEGASLRVVGLDVENVTGLKRGCCAIGYWSPHRIAVAGVVVGDVLYVTAALEPLL